MMCEPLRGWRHVKVSERRTRRDYARCVRELVEVHYPQAVKIRLVQDNLNTHDGASLDRRLDSQALIAREVAAWESKRNDRKARIHWTFTLAAARHKLRKLYPSI